MSSPNLRANYKELEKYVKHMFFKTAQVIIQSRQGGKSCTESQPNPKSQSWFSIAISDNSEISQEAKKIVSSAQVAGQGILAVPLCIEISLKTTEGDLLVMENWVISMKDRGDPTIRTNTVYNHMGLLLKSILCVSRMLPAYKFARRQGPDTHVMCYRIFAGEPNLNPLGSGHQTSQIGQVVTGYGTLCVRVEYRTQMTITPSCNLGSDPNNHSTGSLQSSPFWAKSDHFTSSDNLEGGGAAVVRRNVNATTENTDSGNNLVTTSDESSEAVRIFATSPPDNYNIHKRFSDHYSSNESLHPTKFRSRSNTNQSHKSDDSNSGSTEVKVGAFAMKPAAQAAKEEITDDDFLDLFNLEDKLEENLAISPAQQLRKKEAKKLLQEDAVQEEEDQHVPLTSPFPTVNFGLGAPFLSNPDSSTSDLGIFFKEVQAAPDLKLVQECDELTEASLTMQLNNLSDQLMSYESKSAEYDDLLKVLETTATTSESESEAY